MALSVRATLILGVVVTRLEGRATRVTSREETEGRDVRIDGLDTLAEPTLGLERALGRVTRLTLVAAGRLLLVPFLAF